MKPTSRKMVYDLYGISVSPDTQWIYHYPSGGRELMGRWQMPDEEMKAMAQRDFGVTIQKDLVTELRARGFGQTQRMYDDGCNYRLLCDRAANALEEKDKTIGLLRAVREACVKDYDRALAEIERLTAELAECASIGNRIVDEKLRIAAERDRLTAERDRMNIELRAEMERSAKHMAERDRLLELLRHAVHVVNPDTNAEWHKRAREALAGGEK